MAPLTSEAFASEAKAGAGINVILSQKTFNFAFANYNDAELRRARSTTNDWGVNDFGGFTDDFWPTTNSIFNTGGTYNQGAYHDPTPNSLVHNSVYGTSRQRGDGRGVLPGQDGSGAVHAEQRT